MSDRRTGVISAFNRSGGYGSIHGADGTRFIVHRHSMRAGYTPHLGITVTFSVSRVPAGLLAFDVAQADSADEADSAPDYARPPRKQDGPRTYRSGTPGPVDDVTSSNPASDRALAQALLYQRRGDDKSARRYFESGMSGRPTSMLVTAYAAFERNRNNAAGALAILRRGLDLYKTDFRIRAHLLAAVGQIEYRSGDYSNAALHLCDSIAHTHGQSNSGQAYRYLALCYAKLGASTDAWQAVTEAVTRGVSFAEDEARLLLPHWFGGEWRRLSALVRLLAQLDFRVVSLVDRLDNRTVQRGPNRFAMVVRPQRPEYRGTYDLDDDIVVICEPDGPVDYQTVSAAEQLFEECHRSANVNPTVFIHTVASVLPLRQQLMRRAERPGKSILIPIDDTLLEQSEHTSVEATHRDFQGLLRDWLFQVDRFLSNQPVSGRNFFGREKVLGAIESLLDESQSLGVFGLRKIGKTSLLQQIKERRFSDVVAYVDLQALPPGAASVAYVLRSVGRRIADDASSKYGSSVLQGTAFLEDSDSDVGDAGKIFDHDLDTLRRNIVSLNTSSQVKIIVLLDEIERIIPLPHRAGMPGCDALMSYLRGKAQQAPWFVTVVAGANARIIEDPQWAHCDNPVFRFYQPFYVAPLEASESKEMIEVLGRGMGVAFEPSAIDAINEAGGCHPFVVRQLCSFLSRRSTERPAVVTVDQVLAALPQFALEEFATFREIVERLERDFPAELLLLEWIATFGSSSLEDLEAAGLTQAQESIGHLLGYSLLRIDESLRYDLSFGLLRDWLVRMASSARSVRTRHEQ